MSCNERGLFPLEFLAFVTAVEGLRIENNVWFFPLYTKCRGFAQSKKTSRDTRLHL